MNDQQQPVKGEDRQPPTPKNIESAESALARRSLYVLSRDLRTAVYNKEIPTLEDFLGSFYHAYEPTEFFRITTTEPLKRTPLGFIGSEVPLVGEGLDIQSILSDHIRMLNQYIRTIEPNLEYILEGSQDGKYLQILACNPQINMRVPILDIKPLPDQQGVFYLSPNKIADSAYPAASLIDYLQDIHCYVENRKVKEIQDQGSKPSTNTVEG